MRNMLDNSIFSWNNAEITLFLKKSGLVKSTEDNPLDIAQRILMYMAKNIVHGDELTRSEIKKLGPYRIHSHYPRAIRVLRACSGDHEDHAVLFVSLMRAAGIPARILRVRRDDDGYIETKAEFYAPTVGWLPCNPSSKNPGGESLGVFSGLTLGFNLGVAIELKKSQETKDAPRLARVPLAPVEIFPLLGDYEAQPEEAMDTCIMDCATITGASVEDETKFRPMGSSGWFDESKYDPISDMISDPPPIWIPIMDDKLLLEENKRLEEEFKAIDFQTTSKTFIEHLVKKEFKEAQLMFGPDLGKRAANQGDIVGLLKQDLKRHGLTQVAISWPNQKNEIKVHPFNKWKREEKWVGNQMVIIKVPAAWNGTEVLISIKFVHSRGSAIFDLDVTFNVDFSKGEGHMIGQESKRQML